MTSIVVTAFAPAAHAQCWISNGVAFVNQTSTVVVQEPHLVPDGVGGTFVVWADDHLTPGASDIFAVRFDGNGCLVSGWNAQGDVVCAATGAQRNPQAVADNAGGLYIVWEDYRSGNSNNSEASDVYAQHLTAAGTRVAGWDANGNVVSNPGGGQLQPQLAADGANGVFVAWQDDRGAFPQALAQRMSFGGAASWGSNGVFVSPVDMAALTRTSVASDGAGGMFVCFVSGTTDLFAQHLSSSGFELWDASVAEAHACFNATLLPDGAGGVYLSYEQRASASFSLPADIMVTRLTGDGSTPSSAWPVTACGDPASQIDPRMVSDGAGGVIIAWDDGRNSGFTAQPDYYATRIDGNGDLASPCWIANGNPVAVGVTPARSQMQLTSATPNGAVLVWTQGSEIRGREVRANGAVDVELLFSSGPNSRSFPVVVQSATGKIIEAWDDSRSGTPSQIRGSTYATTSVKPAGITSVTVPYVASMGVDVDWTVPGSDPVFGAPVSFDLRWSTSAITEATFDTISTGVVVGAAASGDPECYPPAPLHRCANYHFAMRTIYCGIHSSLSNIANATTLCRGYTLPDCFGGFQLQPAPGDESSQPLALDLASPLPNPSSGATSFDFSIPSARAGSAYELAVFDVSGRRIARIDGGIASAGRFRRTWDARTDQGAAVHAGTYFVRFTIGDQVRVRTLVLTR